MQTLLSGFLVLVVFTGASEADLIFENWPVGFTCNTSAQCRSLFPGSHCAYNGCLCIKGHYYDWKKIACVPRLLLGETCSNDIECSSLLMCNGNKCVCMPGYKQVKDWCEPLQKRDDLDSFIEFPVDEPNFLTVIIRGLGIIILKVTLFYLLAKVMCFSCRYMVPDRDYENVVVDSMSDKCAASAAEEGAASGFCPSTIASAVQYPPPVYLNQPVSFEGCSLPSKPTSSQRDKFLEANVAIPPLHQVAAF